MLLSLIIPAYNEEKRILPSLEKVLNFLGSKDYKSEVIVVDDGSSDKTVEMVESAREAFQKAGVELVVLRNPTNRGKGYSIRNGVLNARGEIVAFSDADLSAPITELDKLMAPILAGDKDVVFGSRALSGSVILQHQPLLRELAGRTFNLVMRVATGLPFRDTQCGFKAYRLSKIRPVFELQRIDGFGFDVEVLFVAHKYGLRLQEVPVLWSNVEGTKVTLAAGVRTFLDLLTVRWNYFLGRYELGICNANQAPVHNR
ncbi:MAG: glycosyltransferase family 2 protein [Acidobacteriota bacterium]|nr:glycosyltransferase family 2 protein [Blastocatellia bacterium]MDW8413530.1 glycosyltransferase family 2 protein [Acidobacteriota bacterium]